MRGAVAEELDIIQDALHGAVEVRRVSEQVLQVELRRAAHTDDVITLQEGFGRARLPGEGGGNQSSLIGLRASRTFWPALPSAPAASIAWVKQLS